MAAVWSLERGATPLAGGSTRFAVWAPAAASVDLLLLDEPREELTLERGSDGVWEGVAGSCEPGTDYLYRLSGERERPDPVSRFQPHGVHGPSRVVDPSDFRWTDEGWGGVEMADLVLYELHVGTFSPEGTFDAVAERLGHLVDLGVTAIELMPVAAFPGRRNWGYDGAHPYAPQVSYGGPAGLRRLVDAAHARGLAVILDVVYNHIGPEGAYLAEYGPYFTDRYGTPWGLAVNFDGRESDAVRRYFIDNALYWMTEYHIDGLRLDAVQAIFDFSAHHFLAELAGRVHRQAEALGRRVVVIAESDLNDPRLVHPPATGGYGLDAMWDDDFHHAVHACLTGERDGYYVDFGRPQDITRAFRDRFVLDGRYSEYRRRRHGARATGVPADRFVVFIQNHDQVGNRAQGERLDALLDFAARKLAAALLLLSPYVPLLFMGEEYGETSPFQYFVDHGDPQLAAAVRQGRQREFERFDWRTAIPDPSSETTFRRSIIDLGRAERSPHRELLRLYKDLLRLRRERQALRPGSSTVRVEADGEAGWLAASFECAAERLVAVFNLAESARSIEVAAAAGRWLSLLSTDDVAYGGSGSATSRAAAAEGGELRLELAGRTAALFAAEGRP